LVLTRGNRSTSGHQFAAWRSQTQSNRSACCEAANDATNFTALPKAKREEPLRALTSGSGFEETARASTKLRLGEAKRNKSSQLLPSGSEFRCVGPEEIARASKLQLSLRENTNGWSTIKAT
jgi:hypothetical protein